MQTDRPFFIVFSTRTPDNIAALIQEYYDRAFDESDNSMVKHSLNVVEKYKGKQTSRTLVVIDKKVYDLLKVDEDELQDFKIHRLEMRPHYFPRKSNNDTNNLFVRVPHNLDLSTCQRYLLDRMDEFKNVFGFKIKYSIVFPGYDRQFNKHGGKAYINFEVEDPSDEVLADIALCRLFINNTLWTDSGQEVHCMWAQTGNHVKKEDSGDTKTTKVEPVKTGKPAWDGRNGKH